MNRYVRRKHEAVNRATMEARAAMDYLWLEPFHQAYRKVTWAGQTDAPSVYIRFPFPFDDDSAWWCEKIHGLWKSFGYALRPGGPAGWAQDIIRLDKE